MTAADEAYDRLHGLDGCAQSPARALRDAALFFEREMSRAWGGDAQWLTTGRRVAGVVADVLREEAADLDAERVADVLREISADNKDSEGVGTGAGEGATGQDTGTAWVTRSADCPEAPAQAHLLGPDGFTPLAPESVENARRAEQAERRAEDAEAAIEATRDLLDGWEQDGPDDPVVHLLIQRVREMLALGERFRANREGVR